MQDTLAVLKAARERISDPSQWVKEYYCNPRTGAVCAEGAVGCGTEEGDPYAWHDDALNALQAALPHAFRSRAGAVVVFNDAFETTHADVLAAFDRAIAAEEAKRRQTVPQRTPRVRDDAGCERVTVHA